MTKFKIVEVTRTPDTPPLYEIHERVTRWLFRPYWKEIDWFNSRENAVKYIQGLASYPKIHRVWYYTEDGDETMLS